MSTKTTLQDGNVSSATQPNGESYLKWEKGLEGEREFWRVLVEERGYDDRYRIKRPVFTRVREMLPRRTDGIEILDVGAGPISQIGTLLDDGEVKIIQVDVLDDYFRGIMQSPSPHESYALRGEDMKSHFGNRRFDLVYASNSVDHCEDPESVLGNIGKLTRGPVFLEHLQNCATINGWNGLHQWNFDVQDDRVVLCSRTEQIDVAETVGAKEWEYSFAKPARNTVLRWRGWRGVR